VNRPIQKIENLEKKYFEFSELKGNEPEFFKIRGYNICKNEISVYLRDN